MQKQALLSFLLSPFSLLLPPFYSVLSPLSSPSPLSCRLSPLSSCLSPLSSLLSPVSSLLSWIAPLLFSLLRFVCVPEREPVRLSVRLFVSPSIFVCPPVHTFCLFHVFGVLPKAVPGRNKCQKVFWRRVCSSLVRWWPAGSQLFKDAVSMMKAGGRSGNNYCQHFGAVVATPFCQLLACFKYVLLCCVGCVVRHHRLEVKLACGSWNFWYFARKPLRRVVVSL